MYSRERQHAILDALAAGGRVAVAELAGRLDVSTETIRRDLSRLERDGRLERTHGGAVPVIPGGRAERALALRTAENTAAKRAIGRRALDLLPAPGGSVLIDAGSTTAQLAAGLRAAHDVTVITGSSPIASTLAASDLEDLHLYGGRVRPLTGACVGEPALEFLSRLKCDVAFLGTNGIAAERGLTTPHPDEAAVKRAMISAARRVIVLADSSKFGTDDLASFGSLDEIDVIVSECAPTGPLRTAIDHAGIEVLAP